MNKEEALNDFLKGLRIVLNNASAYYKEHTYFRKSVETFKQKIDALFPRIEEKKVMAEEQKAAPSPAVSETGEGIITIEDLMKVDIRIGTVRSAEAVRGSTKLLRLGIDDGEGGRWSSPRASFARRSLSRCSPSRATRW